MRIMSAFQSREVQTLNQWAEAGGAPTTSALFKFLGGGREWLNRITQSYQRLVSPLLWVILERINVAKIDTRIYLLLSVFSSNFIHTPWFIVPHVLYLFLSVTTHQNSTCQQPYKRLFASVYDAPGSVWAYFWEHDLQTSINMFVLIF